MFLCQGIDEDIENDWFQDWFLGEPFSSPHLKKSPLSQPSAFYPLNLKKELFFKSPLNSIPMEHYKTIFENPGERGWLNLLYSCPYWHPHRCPESWSKGFPLWKLCWFFSSWLCSSCALRTYFIKENSFYQGWEGGSQVCGSQNLLWAVLWDGTNPGRQHCVPATVVLQHFWPSYRPEMLNHISTGLGAGVSPSSSPTKRKENN